MFGDFTALLPDGIIFSLLTARFGRERYFWHWETLDEIITDISESETFRGCYLLVNARYQRGDLTMKHQLEIESGLKSKRVSTLLPDRAEVDRLQSQIISHLENATLTCTGDDLPNIFIAHGGNAQWKDLKNHLSDQQGFKVTAFETGDRAGHHIRDILEGELESNNFASLTMTAEDEQAGGTFRARQNVVHEAELFQGRLGFSKAVILREEG